MDKIGHLVMTKSLSGNIHRAHKAALLFGSILPDLLVYTYLEGHTWEATFEQITKQMEVLEAKGRGVALKDGQTLLDLFEERSVLYEKYADLIIDEGDKGIEETLEILKEKLS